MKTGPLPTLADNKLVRMVEISRVLNSTTNLDQLLSSIINEAADLINTEAASILLLDPNTRQLHFKASSNDIPEQMADMPVSLDDSIAGAIFTENRLMHIPDVTKDGRWNQNVDEAIEFKTKSILGVPMHNVDQKPVGVLEAINKQGGAFTKQDAAMLTVLADIAGVAVEKARLFEQLEAANAELNELDQIKTNFISIASHELRTPLAVILGYVSFLREEADPAMAGQFDSVLDAAVHLRGLIQDMLNLQYVDAGQKAEPAIIDLTEHIENMNLDKDATMEAKSQQITISLPSTPMKAKIDANMLDVVINNLMGNAVKFTPREGAIEVSLTQNGSEAWITIADSGVGIPQDQVDRIFKRFYQVESALVRKHEGMGLGLSIAKDLVELNNGRIWAENRPPQGSQFVVAFNVVE
ncbi:MAG: GAF domain-containing sensor histidine kinase [Chloroflexota bacterium]